MANEEKEEQEAVVLDTNVILASILKHKSYTRQVIIYFIDILGIETFVPEKALQEIEEHLEELAKRKKVKVNELQTAIKILLLNANIVEKNMYQDSLGIAEECVRDPGDIDFAALAVHLARRYKRIILLTWNRNDYKNECLRSYGVAVYAPSEIKYFQDL